MQTLQLYIEGTRIDLFNDESISLTQTIQNVRDIGKVFTDFSKSFTLPASKTNNKIFKHYYNFDIDGGFDGRKKVGATIELNNLTFTTGRVKLEGVDLKENKPYAYRVTFFGNTVNLKDKLGNAKLSALTWLNNFSYPYRFEDIVAVNKAAVDIEVDGVTYIDALACPLVLCDNKTDFDNTTGNMNIDHLQLKYSIRLWLIVKAIEESNFGIQFTDDSFIKQTNNPQYYNLHMWMNRAEGRIDTSVGFELYDKFTPDSSIGGIVLTNDTLYNYTTNVQAKIIVRGRAAGSDPEDDDWTDNEFTVTIKNGLTTFYEEVVTDGRMITDYIDLPTSSAGYQIFIDGEPNDYFDAQYQLIVFGNYYYPDFGGFLTLGEGFQFSPVTQIPEIKIIDFLTGLFKMFNLTAYEVDGKIKVQSLDDFYATGTTRDITPFVDTSDSSVDVALPYTEIKFEYEGRDSYLTKQYEENEGIGWGTVEYTGGDIYDGQEYVISVPFEHMQFFNIPLVGGGFSSVQFGFMSDEEGTTVPNFKSELGLPLLYYPLFVSSSNTITVSSEESSETYSNFTIPSNSVSTNVGISDDTCHFSVEVNENGKITGFNGSLFANYYQDYIADVFNSKRRLTKVKAYLPTKFLITYSLADTLIIADKQYKINSITTNLNTGESSLELLNIV